MRCDTSSGQERRLNSALYVPCSLVQLARVVVVRVILVGVLGVIVDVLIGRHTVGAILVAILVVIFCNWRMYSLQIMGLMIFFLLWNFPISVAMRSSLLDHVVWN